MLTNSHPSLNPPRKRQLTACNHCHDKKVKCDGGRPQCSNCERTGVDCVYVTLKKKRGPQPGYIGRIEQRLSDLERLLKPLVKHLKQNKVLEPPATKKQRITSHINQQITSAENPEEDSSGSISSTDNFNSDSDQEFAESISPITRLKPLPITSSTVSVPHDHDLELIKQHPYLTDHLIDLFFSFVFPLFPLIHQVHFLKLHKANKAPRLLLYSMHCVAARFSTHPLIVKKKPSEAGEPFFLHSKKLLKELFDDIPSTWLIQSLLLLGFHEFGAGRASQALTYSNMGTQKAIQLGLNSEGNYQKWIKNGKFNYEEIEEMRMIWWMSVVVDTGCSATSGNALLISDELFDVQLPNVSDFYFGVQQDGQSQNQRTESQAPSQGCFFGHLTTLLLICRKILFMVNNPSMRCQESISSKVDQLNGDIDRYKKNLPRYLKFVHVAGVGWRIPSQFAATLHIILNQAVIVLNRPYCMTKSFDEAFNSAAFKRCMSAADSISQICHLFEYHNPPVIHPIVSYVIYTASTVHAFGSMSPNADVVLSAKNNLEILSNALLRIDAHWGLAKKCSIIVRDFISQNVSSVMQRITGRKDDNGIEEHPRMVFSGVTADSTGVIYFTVLQGPGQTTAHVTADFLATESSTVISVVNRSKTTQKMDLSSVSDMSMVKFSSQPPLASNSFGCSNSNLYNPVTPSFATPSIASIENHQPRYSASSLTDVNNFSTTANSIPVDPFLLSNYDINNLFTQMNPNTTLWNSGNTSMPCSPVFPTSNQRENQETSVEGIFPNPCDVSRYPPTSPTSYTL